MIWLRVNRIAASAFRPSAGLLATAMAYDWVLLCGGTFAVIAMVAAAVRRRKTQGLIVGVWYLGFVALCVLGGRRGAAGGVPGGAGRRLVQSH